MPGSKRRPPRAAIAPLVRINEQIRAPRLRVVGADGEYLDILDRDAALARAREAGFDLIEISPNADPPVAKIMDYGKFQYVESKRSRDAKQKAHLTETKSLQVKIGTGEHDLELKAKRASAWLKEGHRVKIDLFLPGRAKYLDRAFLEERLRRVLNLIVEPHRASGAIEKSPKGLAITIERAGKKQHAENQQILHETDPGHEK